jgi:hypothetical protein
MAMTAKEIERKYGISTSKLEEVDERAAVGELPGEPGPVSAGRPLKFGTALKMVGYKAVPETVEAIDRLYGEISRLKTEIKIKKEMQKANKD